MPSPSWRGGTPPKPVNAPTASTATAVTPGVPAVVRVTEIIIVPGGALEGIFTYSSDPPAAGTLIESGNVAMDGVDAYGNHYLQGFTTYGSGSATQLYNGTVSFYTGSLAGGWTAAADIYISGSVIVLSTSGGVITSNNTLDNGSGGASLNGAVYLGSLSLGTPAAVSGDSSTTGLPNGQISGTSGGASAGTAHTHGPGSYAVTNGQHYHGAGTYEVT